MSRHRYRVLETPVGSFRLIAAEDGSIRTGWTGFGTPLPESARLDQSLLPELAGRLERQFNGEAIDFSDIPIPKAPSFHVACWAAARRIPHGTCMSYAQLASAAGSPRGARAAGQAMRHNPQPIITPCHRVISASGGPGGFSGSDTTDRIEVRTKCALLDLEGVALRGG